MTTQEGTLVFLGDTSVTNADNEGVADVKKLKEFFEIANQTQNTFCPIRDIISRLSDKWSILIILGLGGFGTLRFNELKNKIDGVSQRMLTLTLKNLEGDGIVSRTVHPEIPPRVEYRLTQLGVSLLQQFSSFTDWAVTHTDEISANRLNSVT